MLPVAVTSATEIAPDTVMLLNVVLVTAVAARVFVKYKFELSGTAEVLSEPPDVSAHALPVYVQVLSLNVYVAFTFGVLGKLSAIIHYLISIYYMLKSLLFQ